MYLHMHIHIYIHIPKYVYIHTHAIHTNVFAGLMHLTLDFNEVSIYLSIYLVLFYFSSSHLALLINLSVTVVMNSQCYRC